MKVETRRTRHIMGMYGEATFRVRRAPAIKVRAAGGRWDRLIGFDMARMLRRRDDPVWQTLTVKRRGRGGGVVAFAADRGGAFAGRGEEKDLDRLMRRDDGVGRGPFHTAEQANADVAEVTKSAKTTPMGCFRSTESY